MRTHVSITAPVGTGTVLPCYSISDADTNKPGICNMCVSTKQFQCMYLSFNIKMLLFMWLKESDHQNCLQSEVPLPWITISIALACNINYQITHLKEIFDVIDV